MTDKAAVYCGNQDCPEQPSIDEPTNAAYENRIPCPVCGSRARTFAISVGDSAPATDSTTVARQPGEQQNVEVHAPTAMATINTHLSVSASGDVQEQSSKLLFTGIGIEVTHGVKVMIADLDDRPDAPCVIEVQTLDGDFLVSGLGETAADAIASVFEHMLPATSSEYLPPDDDVPEHDG